MKYIVTPRELKELTKAPVKWYIHWMPGLVYIGGILFVAWFTGSTCAAISWPIWLIFKVST